MDVISMQEPILMEKPRADSVNPSHERIALPQISPRRQVTIADQEQVHDSIEPMVRHGLRSPSGLVRNYQSIEADTNQSFHRVNLKSDLVKELSRRKGVGSLKKEDVVHLKDIFNIPYRLKLAAQQMGTNKHRN